MNRLRYWSVILLLGMTVAVLYTRGDSDVIPAREPLSFLPNGIAGWTGKTIPIDQETLDVLGSGDFLARGYVKPGQRSPIDLFIGYFPTQRTGTTIHSPKHCLPGAGWAFESTHYVTIRDAENKAHKIGEYVIANGDNKDVVIYWYESHGRSVANEFEAKIYMVTDAMRLKRTDGALVRVISPVGPNENPALAMARAEAFTEQLAPMLPRFIPN